MHKQIAFLSFLLLFAISEVKAQSSVQAVPLYDISVSFDIPASRLSGEARMELEAGRAMTLDVSGLLIKDVTINDAAVKPDINNGKMSIKAARQGVLSISYEAVFRSGATPESEGRTVNIIGSGGIMLTNSWYPGIDGLARYRLRAVLPKGYEALSEADDIVSTSKGSETEFEFRFDHPSERITLAASDRYEIVRDHLNGTDLYAYVFGENQKNAVRHLQQVKTYLESYGKSLVPYPYKRFTIVENILPSAQSRPTMILLDRDTAQLAAIPEIFLSRELLSQWFGCSVYTDKEKGNWADGLITYIAEHGNAEKTGQGWEFRKQTMSAYDIFTNPENEISLREYRDGKDRALLAVGQGKSALVFHMLKRDAGDDVFLEAIREFISSKQYQKATWDDIRAEFEKKSGRSLAGFFAQWLDGKGLPEFIAGRPMVMRKGEQFEILFELNQKGSTFEMQLPVQISLSDGSTKKEVVKLIPGRKRYSLTVDREPRSLVLDGDYETARRLTDAETAPVLTGLLGGQKFLIALPESNGEVYAPVIAALKKHGGEEKPARDITNESVKQSSVAVLGRKNPLITRLYGKTEQPDAQFSVIIRKNPLNDYKVIAVIDAQSAEQADATLLKLPEYGQFSRLAFDQGVNVLKAVDESKRGIKMELRQPAAAVDLSALRSIDDIITTSAEKRIVYIGEYHDKYAHHAVQLDMIKGLYEKNPKLAIGMEMFQRPFQKVLDDYINGSIDERAFLKGTEYFKRWAYDYNLYKPILDFARSRKIPVIALNQKKEITEKISKSGMDSLTPEERAEIPMEMDFSDNEYRDRLKTIFEMHRRPDQKGFDNFYSAQILWDETMAFSVDEFLRKSPDFLMVVIAGGGHLAFGSGIPKRAFRRNGLSYSIVLNDGDIDKNIADYLILPQEIEGVAAPRMMASLTEDENSVGVAGLSQNSVLKKAGIRAGDMILALDGEPVENVEDIKLALFYKQKGDTLKVKILRKRLFLSDKEMEFDVLL